jgi:phosphotransferase system HPr (HPr) family protein
MSSSPFGQGDSPGTQADQPLPEPDGSSPVSEGPDAMNGDTLHSTVVVTNPQGFHMRPVTAFAELANRFQSTVTVTKDGKAVNGKSPLELMFLAAEQGSRLELQVSGPDAREALHALVELINTLRFDDENPLEARPPQKG